MLKKINQFIKLLREKKGLSQKDVADKLGMSRPSYISVEQGKRELSLSEAQKFTDLFGISLKDMETGLVPDYEKYKEMILSFLRFFSLTSDGKIPKTKLAKLLYLADFAWFYENLESMSGMQYRRIKFGPVPDLYFRALDELEMEGKISINRKYDSLLISENKGSKRNNLERLSKKENKLIKEITKKWEKRKTNEIVNFTHNQLPYLICSEDEIIPYSLITQEDPAYVY
jgi:transcriptional regulator with XRE-family HTH domain